MGITKNIKFHHISGAAALIIAAVSAIFSVYGLSTLFAGSKLAVIIMASALEVGKILSVSIIYNYAKKLPAFIRKYLATAIFVLMIITSIGVGGFLTNAYQQSADIVNTSTTAQSYNTDQQNLIAEEINNIRQQIANDQTRANTLNEQRTKQEERLTQAQQALNKRMQADARNDIKLSDEEIKSVNSRISSSYAKIAEKNTQLRELKQESFKIREEDRKIDVGPLRYLSKLFNRSMDSIVSILILILILVFDPLAIVLWLSTNAIMKSEKREYRSAPQRQKNPDTEMKPFGQVLREEFEKFKKQRK